MRDADPGHLHRGDSHSLFYGLEVATPWPESYPKGRLIPEEGRHQTLSFLGPLSMEKRGEFLAFPPRLPLHSALLGAAGYFDSLLFLPPERARVIALRPRFLSGEHELLTLAFQLQEALLMRGCQIDSRPLLPHVTLARTPFNREDWERSFQPLPFFFRSLHLYESLGELNYHPLTTLPLPLPIEELEHTADVAFRLRGKNLTQLALHAQLALAFLAPSFLELLEEKPVVAKLVDLVQLLNRKIFDADRKFGSPFKAVSQAGELKQEGDLLIWEMIIDV